MTSSPAVVPGTATQTLFAGMLMTRAEGAETDRGGGSLPAASLRTRDATSAIKNATCSSLQLVCQWRRRELHPPPQISTWTRRISTWLFSDAFHDWLDEPAKNAGSH